MYTYSTTCYILLHWTHYNAIIAATHVTNYRQYSVTVKVFDNVAMLFYVIQGQWTLILVYMQDIIMILNNLLNICRKKERSIS